MTDGWRELAIGDIAEIVGGGTPSTTDPTNFDGDIPWVTPKDLSGYPFRFIYRGERNISERGLKNSSARLLPAGAILLTTRAPIGYVAIASVPLATNQGFRSLVLREGFDSEFVYYLLRANGETLKSHASGTTFGELAGSTLKKLRFIFPPLSEQRAIAHILGTLDDKIELNRQMSQTLEQMARALFKAWFVDFEPVRAKIEGRWRRGESLSGLPAHLYDLFPDRLVDSELGEIPEGWEVGSFFSIANLLSGGTPSTEIPEYWDGNIPWVSAKDVSRAKGSFLLETEKNITQAGVQNSNAKILPALTTVITARGTVGNYCLLGIPMAMNQTNYGLKAMRDIGDYYVFFAIGELIADFRQQSYGTIFDTITTANFRNTKILIPIEDVLSDFHHHVQPMMEKRLQIEHESRTLAALRDALLPKLISGEIRVKDAERFLKKRGL